MAGMRCDSSGKLLEFTISVVFYTRFRQKRVTPAKPSIICLVNMETACKVVVKGRVTGVGFRYSTVRQAAAFPSLKGYVRNVGPSEVEALFQGEESEVDRMAEWMKSGPGWARVDNYSKTKLPLSGNLPLFTVR